MIVPFPAGDRRPGRPGIRTALRGRNRVEPLFVMAAAGREQRRSANRATDAAPRTAFSTAASPSDRLRPILARLRTPIGNHHATTGFSSRPARPSLAPAHPLATPRSTLLAVMLVSLLGTSGIALPYPVLAPFFLDPETNNALTRFAGLPPKLLLGVLLALYPLGILLGSSVMGALSDSYGRKRVLVISLVLAAAGYGLTAGAVQRESYLLFALARFLTGLCEGNIAVSRAIALELHPAIERTRAISLLYATTYAGWLVGPLAGGYLMYFGVASVFLIAGVVTLVALVAVLFAIERQPPAARSRSLWRALAADNSLGLLQLPDIRPFVFYHLLFTLGLNAFYEFYPLWLVEYFGFTPVAISWSTVALTVAMIAASVYAVSPLEDRFGPLGAIRRFSLLFGAGLLLLPVIGAGAVLPAFAVLGALIAVANGVFPSFMANRFEEQGLGRVQGLLTTNFCVANVIIALAGSVIALLGSAWSLVAGGLLCLCASGWLWLGPVRRVNAANS